MRNFLVDDEGYGRRRDDPQEIRQQAFVKTAYTFVPEMNNYWSQDGKDIFS